MSQVTIRSYQSSDELAWNDYVRSHDGGTVFHLTSWKQAVAATFGHPFFCLLAEEEVAGRKSVRGILPLCRVKSFLFGDYIVSVPFAELGGVLADCAEVEGKLVAAAAELSRELGCDYVEYRNRKPLAGLKTKNLYVNFSREIFPVLDDNMKAIPRKSRAMVRQGIKNGLTAHFGNDLLCEFYEVLARSYHSLGTPVFTLSFFRNLLAAFGDQSSVMVVRNPQGQSVAAVLTFYYGDCILPYYAGSLREFRNLAPNDFMYWELMRHGWEKGCKVFDFGRSKEGTGSYDFKRHWGFEPSPLAYQYELTRIAELPNLSPANPKYARKIEMWRKLPFFATKIIGPPLARYLA